uniref:Uncharacterized protein n=1 Tax=Odontella aurita TaxID=265563 RepID=A0A7S4NI46_9STRA|mmetsp:Transcript_730/g.2156  ORF Transcript_730/g.2156 Transcript_730/m.2156 type:complete len:257 (+) Transcript_730:162-932(+)
MPLSPREEEGEGQFDEQVGRFQQIGDDRFRDNFDEQDDGEGLDEGGEEIEDELGNYERGEGVLGEDATSTGDVLEAARKYQDLAARRQKTAQRTLTRARKEAKAAAAEKRKADEYVAMLERRARGEEIMLSASGAASKGDIVASAASAHNPNVKRTRMRFDVHFKQKAILEYEELKQMHAIMGKQYQQKTYCEEKMGAFNQGMLSRWLKARNQILAAAKTTVDGPVKSIHRKDGSDKKKRKRRKTVNQTKHEKDSV